MTSGNIDKKTFDWTDPLDFTARLTEEERMISEAAHAYAREKLLPRIVSAFAEERFDRDVLSEMGELGFLGVTLPEEYGGSTPVMSLTVSSPARSRRSIPAIARR